MNEDWQAIYAAERGQWIDRIRSAAPLDAAFLFYYYNHWRRSWGPPPGPFAITSPEVFCSHDPESLRDAAVRAEKMFNGAFDMISSMHEARSRGVYHRDMYEPGRLGFLSANPGFDDSSYELAIHAANIALR